MSESNLERHFGTERHRILVESLSHVSRSAFPVKVIWVDGVHPVGVIWMECGSDMDGVWE